MAARTWVIGDSHLPLLIEERGISEGVRLWGEAEWFSADLMGGERETPDVLMISSNMRRPLAAARRGAEAYGHAQLVLVGPGVEDRLKRSLSYGPGLGSNWVAVQSPEDAVANLPHWLSASRQRRRLRTTLDRMNLRLSNPVPATDEVRRLVVSDRFLASILEHAPEAILSLDANGRILTWNQGAASLIGLSEVEAVGQSFDAWLAPSEQAQLHEAIDAVWTGRTAPRFLLDVRRPGGGVVPTEAAVAPLSDEKRRPVAVTLILRDLRELRESERRFRTLVEMNPAGVWITDPDGYLLFVSHSWLEMLGAEAEEARGEGWHRFIHPQDLPPLYVKWREAMRLGKSFAEEHRLRLRDGSYRWVLTRANPSFDDHGQLESWIGVTMDIHPLKEQEEELERRVRERTAELEGFTYSVSHDLRAPIRAIISTAMILEEDFGPSLSEEAKLLLHRQVEAGRKLGSLTDDLLTYARLAGAPMEKSPVDLSSLANEVWEELPPRPAKLEVQPGLTALADPKLIRLVLSNLLDNAAKFSPSGGNVRFFQCREGTFAISDEGMGFDMAYAHKLFRPFERLVRDVVVPGTGIGLANVARIIHRHGGKVWARGKPGKGATFFFSLPYDPA